MVSVDRAHINCALVLVSMSTLMMLLAYPDLSTIWILISVLFYIAQLIEVAYCQTSQLLWCQPSWDKLEIFRKWFYDLKKCRPIVTFKFSPD